MRAATTAAPVYSTDGAGLRSRQTVQVMPLSICVSVFVVSPGSGRSGHSSGHQICRQHPQGLRYVAVHHPVNDHIVLVAAGL